MILAYIIVFTLIGSVGSLVSSYFLLLKQKITESFSNMLISFAAGALISTAFLDLFPEALEVANGANIFIPALLEVIGYVREKGRGVSWKRDSSQVGILLCK